MQRIREEASSMIKSIVWKLSGLIPPAMATGRAKTIQILKMLLPTMLPTSKSDSPFLAAEIVVTNSGRDVPKAMTERDIILSEIPIAPAMKEAEFTTSSLPPTTPTKPRITNRKDLPSLYLGFSTSFLADLPRRFLRAMAMR